MIKNMRCFELKYFGATNSKGARVKIIDKRFGVSKFVDMSYNHMSMKQDAIDFLQGLGIVIVSCAEFGSEGDVLLTNDFEISLVEVKE